MSLSTWSYPIYTDMKPSVPGKKKIKRGKPLVHPPPSEQEDEASLADYEPQKDEDPPPKPETVEEAFFVPPAPTYEAAYQNGEGDLNDRINYMIHLLEKQQDEKTGRSTEEVILYLFLGVFVIFVLDSFVKTGKYSR
jgi:hypothetical protein